MAKFKWSEVFMSIEGEGPYTGNPTAYIRFTGCNFECRGFNNPDQLDTTSVEVLGFNPLDYNSILDIPLITKGCDSIYSWDNKFSHMWTEGDENQLAQSVIDVIPHHQLVHPTTGLPVILSLTGGEPTLRAKQIPALLSHNLFRDLKLLLIETNGSVVLHDTLITYLTEWVKEPNRGLVWSNSPKLSSSGEKREVAINPFVIKQQKSIAPPINRSVHQYFKFVCADERDLDEVVEVMEVYYQAGISRNTSVYIMPTACQVDDQTQIAARIASLCIQHGYIYCHRVHLDVFGNGVGT